MAWVATNLFARVQSADTLVDALEPLLRDADRRADRDGLLGDPPPLTVSAPRDGWSCVCGLRCWIDDMTWAARELSRTPGVGTVVSSELIAQAYRLRHAIFDDGVQRGEPARYPDEGWDDHARDTSADETRPMPLYRDVEQLAYALLLDVGVPRALILLGVEPATVGTVGDGDAPARAIERFDLGEGWLLSRVGAELTRAPLAMRGLDYRGDEALVVPAAVGLDFGLKLYDDRFLEGVPHERAVQRLIQLEVKIQQRARVLYGVPELELTVTYHNAEYQQELDALLAARGRHVAIENTHRRDVPPWWQFWRYFGKFK